MTAGEIEKVVGGRCKCSCLRQNREQRNTGVKFLNEESCGKWCVDHGLKFSKCEEEVSLLIFYNLMSASVLSAGC